MSDPLIGTTLEKVRLLERLGAGGMGTVYLAEHATLRKNVAVKVLAEHLSRDPEFVSRFVAEARTSSKMQHPNIVQVYDVDHVEGRYFITMQYVEGLSLQRLVEEVGPLDPRDAAAVVAKVLRALHYAHGAGIVHRDVKPGNILVGQNDEPYVLDFGLAIETEGTLKLTAAGTVVGTPWYISPEQARGHRAEPRSDIYSAGVTLYFALTGRPPFAGQQALAVLNKHIHETPISPSTLNPRVPPVLDAIVAKMMAKRPEDRYLTAETAARDLDAFLQERPVSTMRAAWPSARAEPARPRPFIWITAGVALAGAAILTWMAVNTKPPPPAPRPVHRPPPDAGDEHARAEVERVRLAALEIDEDYQSVDYAALPPLRDRYEKLRAQYANNPEAVKIVDDFLRHFEDRVESLALDARRMVEAKAAALAPDDPYGALAAYAEFPRPLLELCPSGRAVAKARAELEQRLAQELPGRIRAVESAIEDEEFERARALASYLIGHLQPPHTNRLRRLEELAAERETQARERLTPRLLAEIAALQERLAGPLSRGQTDEAWRLVSAYVASKSRHERRMVRVPGVDYETLAAVEPSDLIEGDIARRLTTLSEAQTGSDPAFRVLILFEDVLQCEWLQRQVTRGIARLEGSRVHLQGIGSCSIYTGDPPTLAPEGQPSRPFLTRGLPPINLIHLAAIARHGPEAPVADAYAGNPTLCVAAGVAYLYSGVRDRWHAAHRWIVKGSELGAAVPRFRLAELREQLELEEERLVRELLGSAVALTASGRFEEARQALEEVERRHRDQQDLMETLARLIAVQRAKVLLAEASAAAKARAWGRVRDLVVKQLRPKYDGLYDRPAADALLHESLLHLGSWSSMPIPDKVSDLTKGVFWEWFGKDRGAPPPLRIFDGALRLDKGGPIFAAHDKTEGMTGASARGKLHALPTPHGIGLYFNVTPDRPLERLLLAARSDGRLTLFSWASGEGREVAAAPLPAGTSLAEWHEVGVVADEGVIVCYFDRRPLFAVDGHIRPKTTFGLFVEGAAGDGSLRDVRLRDGKGR